VYRDIADPILSEHIDWHLNPRINWGNFTQEFDDDLQRNDKKVAAEMKKVAVFEFNTQHGLTVPEIILITFGVICILIIAVYTVIKCVNKKPRVRNPKSRLMNMDKPENQELESINPQMTHHIVIES